MTTFTVLANQLEKAQISGDIVDLEHALEDVTQCKAADLSMCSSSFVDLEQDVRELYHSVFHSCKGWLLPLRDACKTRNEKVIFTALCQCQKAPPDIQLHMYQDMRAAAALRGHLVDARKEALQLLQDTTPPMASSSLFRSPFSTSPHAHQHPPSSSASLFASPSHPSHSPVPTSFINGATPPPSFSTKAAAASSSSPLSLSARSIEQFLTAQEGYLTAPMQEALRQQKEKLQHLATPLEHTPKEKSDVMYSFPPTPHADTIACTPPKGGMAPPFLRPEEERERKTPETPPFTSAASSSSSLFRFHAAFPPLPRREGARAISPTVAGVPRESMADLLPPRETASPPAVVAAPVKKSALDSPNGGPLPPPPSPPPPTAAGVRPGIPPPSPPPASLSPPLLRVPRWVPPPTLVEEEEAPRREGSEWLPPRLPWRPPRLSPTPDRFGDDEASLLSLMCEEDHVTRGNTDMLRRTSTKRRSGHRTNEKRMEGAAEERPPTPPNVSIPPPSPSPSSLSVHTPASHGPSSLPPPTPPPRPPSPLPPHTAVPLQERETLDRAVAPRASHPTLPAEAAMADGADTTPRLSSRSMPFFLDPSGVTPTSTSTTTKTITKTTTKTTTTTTTTTLPPSSWLPWSSPLPTPLAIGTKKDGKGEASTVTSPPKKEQTQNHPNEEEAAEETAAVAPLVSPVPILPYAKKEKEKEEANASSLQQPPDAAPPTTNVIAKDANTSTTSGRLSPLSPPSENCAVPLCSSRLPAVVDEGESPPSTTTPPVIPRDDVGTTTTGAGSAAPPFENRRPSTDGAGTKGAEGSAAEKNTTDALDEDTSSVWDVPPSPLAALLPLLRLPSSQRAASTSAVVGRKLHTNANETDDDLRFALTPRAASSPPCGGAGLTNGLGRDLEEDDVYPYRYRCRHDGTPRVSIVSTTPSESPVGLARTPPSPRSKGPCRSTNGETLRPSPAAATAVVPPPDGPEKKKKEEEERALSPTEGPQDTFVDHPLSRRLSTDAAAFPRCPPLSMAEADAGEPPYPLAVAPTPTPPATPSLSPPVTHPTPSHLPQPRVAETPWWNGLEKEEQAERAALAAAEQEKGIAIFVHAMRACAELACRFPSRGPSNGSGGGGGDGVAGRRPPPSKEGKGGEDEERNGAGEALAGQTESPAAPPSHILHEKEEEDSHPEAVVRRTVEAEVPPFHPSPLPSRVGSPPWCEEGEEPTSRSGSAASPVPRTSSTPPVVPEEDPKCAAAPLSPLLTLPQASPTMSTPLSPPPPGHLTALEAFPSTMPSGSASPTQDGQRPSHANGTSPVKESRTTRVPPLREPHEGGGGPLLAISSPVDGVGVAVPPAAVVSPLPAVPLLSSASVGRPLEDDRQRFPTPSALSPSSLAVDRRRGPHRDGPPPHSPDAVHPSVSSVHSSFPDLASSVFYTPSSSLPSPCFSPSSMQQMRLRGKLLATRKEEAICRKDIQNVEEMERGAYLFRFAVPL